MALAHTAGGERAATGPATSDPSPSGAAQPLVFNPAELRQLWLCYRDLLELHRAEVVDDEDFDDAHRLLVEQLLPLRAILREQEHMIVDPRVDLTY